MFQSSFPVVSVFVCVRLCVCVCMYVCGQYGSLRDECTDWVNQNSQSKGAKTRFDFMSVIKNKPLMYLMSGVTILNAKQSAFKSFFLGRSLFDSSRSNRAAKQPTFVVN